MTAALWRPETQGDFAPSGIRARVRANIEALRVMRTIEAEEREATEDERRILAQWGGWGAAPKAFDAGQADLVDAEGSKGAEARFWIRVQAELAELLSPTELEEAARSTLNAHYTDAAVVRAMIDAVVDLGVPADATVLEPGCGLGAFMGLAPEGWRFVGVEADTGTAKIARALWTPAGHRIVGRTFAEASPYVPTDAFSLVLGNVPFDPSGNIRPYDPVFNKGKLTLHNYAIVWSLHRLHVGGLAAVLTSTGTLDAVDPAHRIEISRLADVVATVRLPNGTMQRAAGTAVAMDLVVLRRRGSGHAVGKSWLISREASIPTGRTISPWNHERRAYVEQPEMDRKRVNERFSYNTGEWRDEPNESGEGTTSVWHPGHIAIDPQTVIGEPYLGRGAHHENELMYRLPEGGVVEVAILLAERVAKQAGGMGWQGPERAVPVDLTDLAETIDDRKPGSLHVSDDGKGIVQITGGTWSRGGHGKPFPVPGTQRAELVALLGIRDAQLAVIKAEAGDQPDDVIDAARAALNVAYDAYAAKYGAINRCTVTTKIVDGEKTFGKRFRPGAVMKFKQDPDFHLVCGLEEWDENDQTATKAAMFGERTVRPRPVIVKCDTLPEAVAVSLAELYRVEPARVAELLDIGEDEATRRLIADDLIYHDPATGRVEYAPKYLSGNVREALAAAELAAKVDPDTFGRNVEALTAVQPAWLGPTEIDARPGAAWIGPKVVQEFTSEVLGTATVVAVDDSKWSVDGHGGGKEWEKWGVPGADALKLLTWSLNQTPAQITKETPEGRRYTDSAATLVALEKQQELGQRFAEWVWEDPERSEKLQHDYNWTHNAVVAPEYDGKWLTLPGMSEAWRKKLRPHQKSVIARGVISGGTFLDHQVGLGKTASLVAIVAEHIRMGLASRAFVAVPNHLTEQWTAEARAVYPAMRILTYDPDVDGGREGQAAFAAKCATGSWHLIVIGHNAFTNFAMSDAFYQNAVDEQVADLTIQLAQTNDEKTVKKIQAKIEAKKEKAKTEFAREKKSRHSVTFDQLLGDDGRIMLVVDEAKEFKNLDLNLPNRSKMSTNRAAGKSRDMAVKCDFVNRRGGRSMVFLADGTPVANGLSELWVHHRYIAHHALKERGLGEFMQWASVFGSFRTTLEVSPEGGGWRMHSRFSRFRNVPELQALWREIAHVVTNGDVKGLNIPALEGGKRHIKVVESSDGLRLFVDFLVERAATMRKANEPAEVKRAREKLVELQKELRDAEVEARQSITATGTYLPGREGWQLGIKWDTDGPSGWLVWAIAPDGRISLPAERFGYSANEWRARKVEWREARELGEAYVTSIAADPEGVMFPLPEALASLPEHKELRQRIAKAETTLQQAQARFEAKRFAKYGLVFPDPDNENMLAICGDGRKAALDLRLVGQNPDPEGGKIAAAADEIARIYHEHRNDEHPDGTRGALQLVFSDIGTPGTKRIPGASPLRDEFDEIKTDSKGKPVYPTEYSPSVYGRMRVALVARGVPVNEIRFAHEGSTTAAKARLHRVCRQGGVSILFGSTALMGAGMNVQNRALAIHFLAPPWRPCDIEQAEGRLFRQGNFYKVCSSYVWVTEGSFDAYMWQTLETKARFIAQVRSDKNVARMIDDVSDANSLEFSEIKAAAAGNQLASLRAQAEAEVMKLRTLRSSHRAQIRDYESRRDHYRHVVDLYRDHARSAQQLSEQWARHAGSERGRTFVDRERFLETVRTWLDRDEHGNIVSLRYGREAEGLYTMFGPLYLRAQRVGDDRIRVGFESMGMGRRYPLELPNTVAFMGIAWPAIDVTKRMQKDPERHDWEALLIAAADRLAGIVEPCTRYAEDMLARANDAQILCEGQWDRQADLDNAELRLAVVDSQIREFMEQQEAEGKTARDLIANPPEPEGLPLDVVPPPLGVDVDGDGNLVEVAEDGAQTTHTVTKEPTFVSFVSERTGTKWDQFQIIDTADVPTVSRPNVKRTRRPRPKVEMPTLFELN